MGDTSFPLSSTCQFLALFPFLSHNFLIKLLFFLLFSLLLEDKRVYRLVSLQGGTENSFSFQKLSVERDFSKKGMFVRAKIF